MNDDGDDREMANQQCQRSAGRVTALLQRYHKSFGDRPTSDFMVIHAALTASIAHLCQLQEPDHSTYRAAVRGLKIISKIFADMSSRCGYARLAYSDLRKLAKHWQAVPACSDTFWP